MTVATFAQEKARKAWGEDVPNWVEALAKACDETSQAKTAARLGYSPATVNLVLSNRYGASIDTVEQIVRGALMSETVPCPVMGKIGKDRCRQGVETARTFSAANSQHVRLFKTCPTCPHHPSNK